ncbi:hypothetical protein Acr_13g0015900 [Actinidia rufa]|uniref:Retrovirus-related Pol polyprotein from transposon TNT 1-94-like beta-barrel domain-containing protein n=1 Tax=Actinidia rufa TaxID=165716 RepID=A0A7J0FNG8_9ERIC|nr:hypothetical protein Acr_13g0015900 [Actinidia rufa]
MIGLIRQCIEHKVFHHVAQETSAYELWIKLEEMYQTKTSRNKALLMRRLVNLKLQRETTVAEHMSEFQNLVNQLTNVELQFKDEMQALLLLSFLLESWETLVVSLSNSAPNKKLTTSMVMDAFFNKEAWRRDKCTIDQSESQALVSEESRERGHHRGTRKGRWRSQMRVALLDTTKTTVMVVDEDESDVLLAASEDGKSNWVLDSGSAYHLCRDRDVFSTYAACEERIWMANNIASKVVGKGSVYFDASGGTLRVSKENKEMLWGKKTGGLYRLEGSVQTGRATVRHGSSGISNENGQGK